MAEDMDLTWSFYHAGLGVRFVPEAVCYPIEPHNFHFMSKQLRRWSHGFVQYVKLHWKRVIDIPVLRSMVAVALFDATVASLAYMILLPLLAIFVNPIFLLAYLIDIPVMVIPVLYKAIQRKEVGLALTSMPGFLVLRTVNGIFLLKALWLELVVNKPLAVYEKGH